MNYLLHILIMCQIYIILALAMNLLAGYSGLLSLSQAAFYGIGAYTASLLLTKSGVSFSIALVGAVLINLVACLPVIWFAVRLRDLFFTLATLAWQIIIFTTLYNWVSVSNGPFGISDIPKPVLFGFRLNSIPQFALFGGTVCVLICVFFYMLHRTPLSRYFQGVRDDQLALMSFGKNPSYYKALAVLISSGISAIAGALFALYFNYIDPTSFKLEESILIASIVLIGGLGSIKGSIAGALFYVLLPEGIRYLNVPDAVAANLQMMIYALILILVVMFRPYGFFGKYRFE